MQIYVLIFSCKLANLVQTKWYGAFLATNTIAQGDTREVGLDQIVNSGWIIPRAISSRKWPGEATLEIAYVWLQRGDWHGTHLSR